MSESAWKFIGHCFDSDPFEIEGIDVWRDWHATGERMDGSDPLYPWQQYNFPVYTMTDGVKTVEFAAGEMSNNVWGFFQKKKKE